MACFAGKKKIIAAYFKVQQGTRTLSTGIGMPPIGTTKASQWVHTPIPEVLWGGWAVAIAVLRERDKQAPTKQEHLQGADGGASGAAPGASSTGRDHADPDLSHPGTVIPQLASAQQAELLTSGDQISLKGARETQILLCRKRFIQGLFFFFN